MGVLSRILLLFAVAVQLPAQVPASWQERIWVRVQARSHQERIARQEREAARLGSATPEERRAIRSLADARIWAKRHKQVPPRPWRWTPVEQHGRRQAWQHPMSRRRTLLPAAPRRRAAARDQELTWRRARILRLIEARLRVIRP